MDFLSDLHLGHAVFLFVALAVAFGFEFVNGFHDTANAVATVIYTKSLRPTVAVVWSGIWNFLGVLLGGIAVAYSIVHLLPVEIIASVGSTSAGLAMVLSLLGAAIAWNLGTWYLGIPASSSHALVGAILGTGLINALYSGRSAAEGISWGAALKVGQSLLLSPLVGFFLAAFLLLALKRLVPNPALYQAPAEDRPPPLWIRATLIGTCTGVSFMHGSNDGQKGMGLIMLVLIGVVPTQFALNLAYDKKDMTELRTAAVQLGDFLTANGLPPLPADGETAAEAKAAGEVHAALGDILRTTEGKDSFRDVGPDERWKLRNDLLAVQRNFGRLADAWRLVKLSEENARFLKTLAPGRDALPEAEQVAEFRRAVRAELSQPVEYVPSWVKLGVALALGIGTMVGWKRIVVTVGEKIGKSHLTYAQGASAELVAMATIGAADVGGLPVSTTHVLSSGVAGTMWANRSGVQRKTVVSLAMAWVLTLPATMALAMGFYWLARLFV